MSLLRAVSRATIICTLIFFGTIFILLLAPLPFKVKGVRLSAWPPTWMARFFLKLFRVEFDCPQAEKLANYHGFIFPNHTSYLDVILLYAIIPTRFLAKSQVKSWPFLGWIAVAVGTLFVNREDKNSRTAAREALQKAGHFPPITLFPEGKIPVSPELSPFRYGAFEIAIQNEMAFMPAVFIYADEDLVRWGDETLFASVWRLARFAGPTHAQLILLPTVTPTADDDAATLATAAYSVVQTTLTQFRDKRTMTVPGL